MEGKNENFYYKEICEWQLILVDLKSIGKMNWKLELDVGFKFKLDCEGKRWQEFPIRDEKICKDFIIAINDKKN